MSKPAFRGTVRRSLLALALALPAGLAFAQQAFPSKMIKIVVPFPPGGPTDVATRLIGEKMGQQLRQTVVVENRAGASGAIAAAAVAKSPADGYTLMMLATPTLLAPHLYRNASYDMLRDFAPIGTAYDLPIVVVVNPQSLPGVNNLQQMIEAARAEKGRLNYTSSGKGSFGHLTMESLKSLGKFEMEHVPYKGGAPAITDVIGGQVPLMYSDMVAALPHIQSGKLRAIAVGSPQRVPFTPDVRTISEQGFPGFDAVSWGGLVVPAGTPKDVVARLSDSLKQALADATVQEKLKAAGTFAAYQTPEQMGERIRRDYEKWGKVIRDKNIAAD
ncbi:Bug family tripartite tricarboxylate transporter substrate binding protein [Caldimonas tepidiphila]|uniref:Bug family tripartite tricarboxylate transporter substrate binding protein n=1 Tax=Caldimonas tepidiphila TaxID=2315841 RepID=UPI000E5AA71D|nr:tripartite tricarboxylate transporter substrate binding protein [Caldimonas tepidiphila]